MGAPFDLTLEEMREHRSAKWSRVAPDVLPAWTAEMDVRTAPTIAAALRTAVDRSDLGYAGARGRSWRPSPGSRGTPGGGTRWPTAAASG
ncbi:hypothetical protein [Ornithinimicrobium flavum]|uniref:hypothetical protein n=1 Tax=Ornithinimicrobium flavum TaxID=1288636 RepID=UPI001930FEEB|nr:hypothetical protein [Ornithinimicrobium flavum]